MQLDNHRIIIRERNMREIMDLALLVIRAHGLPLVLAFTVGVVPMLLLNDWLIGDQAMVEYEDDSNALFGFLYFTLLLIVIETPLAMTPATLFLGQSMFFERTSFRRVAGDLWRSLPQLFFYQILVRGVFVVVGIILVPLAIPYVGWPYLNEVILLERNPLFSGRRKRLTTTRRGWKLHFSMTSDLLARWLTSLASAVLLIVSLWMSIWVSLSTMSGTWSSSSVSWRYYLPVSVWLVICYFTVVRFLAYVDLRIRREGWEVELSMRAEAARLAGRLV